MNFQYDYSNNCPYRIAFQVVQYGTKKKESATIFVDGTKEDEDALKEDLNKIAETYGGGKGVDMLSFPSFKFKEPAIDTTDTLSEEIFFVKGYIFCTFVVPDFESRML